ncbi:hypothetical protein [Priestia aryabhattai]|uniref:hypothetical protein n=1 Tax=Priestia aryabhattai TaxID=412384 RepID=UPI0027E55883|nr:hypothetical protein [Priestia aryabhattai]MCG0050437.1 hypothetical protein [Priestia aryabhattai]
MGRVSEGKRRLTCDIPENLHKELRLLAVQNDTTITKYVQLILEKHVESSNSEKKN